MLEAPGTLAAGALLVVVGSALGVGLLAGALERDRRQQGPTFRALCGALRLDRSQRRLVARLSREAGVRSPAALLISLVCFENALRRAPSARRSPGELEQIRRRVFGDEATGR